MGKLCGYALVFTFIEKLNEAPICTKLEQEGNVWPIWLSFMIKNYAPLDAIVEGRATIFEERNIFENPVC